MNKVKGNIKNKVLSSSMLGLIIVIILMGIVFTVLKPGYISMKNLINILTAASGGKSDPRGLWFRKHRRRL